MTVIAKGLEGYLRLHLGIGRSGRVGQRLKSMGKNLDGVVKIAASTDHEGMSSLVVKMVMALCLFLSGVLILLL